MCQGLCCLYDQIMVEKPRDSPNLPRYWSVLWISRTSRKASSSLTVIKAKGCDGNANIVNATTAHQFLSSSRTLNSKFYSNGQRFSLLKNVAKIKTLKYALKIENVKQTFLPHMHTLPTIDTATMIFDHWQDSQRKEPPLADARFKIRGIHFSHSAISEAVQRPL